MGRSSSRAGRGRRTATRRRRSTRRVDEDYFRAIGVPLVKGRFFEPRDTADAPGVVIINEALARRQWPDEDRGRAVDHVAGPRHRPDGAIAHAADARCSRSSASSRSVKNSTLVRRRRAGGLLHATGSSRSAACTSSCRGRAIRRRCSAPCARRCSGSIRICRWRPARTLDRDRRARRPIGRAR